MDGDIYKNNRKTSCNHFNKNETKILSKSHKIQISRPFIKDNKKVVMIKASINPSHHKPWERPKGRDVV